MAIVIPRNADGSRGVGNGCRGWKEPRGLSFNAARTSSPRAPLTCTTASSGDGRIAAMRSAIALTTPSGTARNRIPLPGSRKPERPGTRRAWSARARLRPRLPRPATVMARSSRILAFPSPHRCEGCGVGRVLVRGGAGRGRGFRLLAGQDLVELFAVDRLHDLQPLDHRVHLAALLGEDRLRGLVAVVDDVANLLIDEGCDLL